MDNDNKHVTEQQVDELYLRMDSSNKKSLTASWLIYIVIFLLLVALFAGAISTLNNQLTTQITANEKLVNRLDGMEQEMKAIRNKIYERSGISVKEVKQQIVSDVIAKKVNRRATPEQLKVLESYQSNENFNDSKDNIYYLTKAVNASAEDNLPEALAMVNRAIELNSHVSTPYSVKSEILTKQKKFKPAVEAQTQAINLEKQLPFSDVLANYYNTRGFLYIQLKDYEKALADFHLGSDIAEGDERSFILENAVLVALYQAKWQQAFTLSDKLIALDVDGGWKWFLRAIAADKLNKHTTVKKSLANWHKDLDENTAQLLKVSLESSNLSVYQKWL